jgi:hypothetical protein
MISLQLYAPNGLAYVSTPLVTPDNADLLASCTTVGPPCISGGGGSQVVPIRPGGTHIYAVAQCTGSCPAGGGGAGLDAQINVFGMSVELTTNATPTATNVAGGLLAAGANGMQLLTFTASDPGGPGVDHISATIDGASVYSAVPDYVAGHCAPVGNDASGVPEWLYAQPCAPSTNVSIPVDTTHFADGTHHLQVVVSDAAGNTAAVIDRSISITNAAHPPVVMPGAMPKANPCTASPQKTSLTLRVRALGEGRLRFTGRLTGRAGCSLGGPAARPLVLIEVKNGHKWQAVGPTARVSPSGGYTTTYGGGRRGSIGGRFTFRAVSPSTAQFTRATSRSRRVRVR